MADIIEEREIDLLEVFRKIWKHRKIVFISTGVAIVLGLIAALATEHKYVTKIAFVPQYNTGMNSRISNLASLAGISLDETGGADGPISPTVYPKILDNKDFLKELAYTPIHFKGYAEPILLIDWFNDEQYQKKNFFRTLMKYTIGLPGVIKDAIAPEKEEESEFASATDGIHAPSLTKEEATAIKALKGALELKVLKTERHVLLSSTMNESTASAEVAIAAYELFKKYISQFKVKKAQSNLDFLESQYAEAKAEYEAKQSALARMKDSHQGRKTAESEIRIQRLQTEAELARMLYLELSKNCLTARVKVTEANVTFTELTPAYVPRKSANSRKTVLIIWTLAGILAGCVIALAKKEQKD